MKKLALLLLPAVVLGIPRAALASAAEDLVHHKIVARLDPANHTIHVTDTLTFPGGLRLIGRKKDGPLRFRLLAGLRVTIDERSDFTLHPGALDESGRLRDYGLRLKKGTPAVPEPLAPRAVLTYEGKIHHPPQAEAVEYARSFSRTPGTIDKAGVFLGGSSWWLPRFDDEMVTFELTADLPAGWDAVSQGDRAVREEKDGRQRVTWVCKDRMDEVYLIANRFHEYSRAAGGVLAQAFLRSPDETLANKYLEVTAQYIEMYRKLLGPYPYKKFAVVENFWETGYGMPSFTLLGPRVIRFPFILHSSYPHEILHNWWGNSVYVDMPTGNWCEGLTAYLADHLVREGQGRGAEYRRNTLKSYRNYVKGEKDFPLTAFRSRHSSATQAVGYGKCLMMFHMLRRRLGDDLFVRGLQRFYRDNLWRRAAFRDIRSAFESVSKLELGSFFDQWVERTGAPELSLAVKFAGDGTLVLEVSQLQDGEPYALDLPVAVTLAGQAEAHVETISLTKRTQQVALQVPGKPLRVDVDPAFDVFRRIHRDEVPASLSQVFGAEKVLILYPPEPGPWKTLGEAWSKRGDVTFMDTSEPVVLPKDRAVWILGRKNPAQLALMSHFDDHGVNDDGDRVDFGPTTMPKKDHSWVFVAPSPENADLAIGWIATDNPKAIPGLARKLPHYGKYSYLGFQGDEPTNVVKGTWETTTSPLTKVLVPGTARAKLPKRTPLARLAPVFDQRRLMEHVRWLADDAREGRGAGTKGLDDAADYIAAAFKMAGLKPGGDNGTWFQTFTAADGPDGKPVTLRNVVGILPGTNAKMNGQSVVLGAHYDHLGRGFPDTRKGAEGQVHNGADDNASGVSVLLELAQLLGKSHKPARSIVFAAFTGEEWGLKGSTHYVKTTKHHPAQNAFAMVNMDTVGRLGAKKLQVLGSGTATQWRHIAMGVGFTTGVESNCVPEDPGGSDQTSFVKVGVPAVQIFTGGHADYHRPTDDADKIDGEGLVKVATFVRETIVYLGDRPDPMTVTIKGASAQAPSDRPRTGRRVSLGTMPAFDFRGPGVKVAAVTKGSPAEAAGIEAGDILLAFDGKPLENLRAFSDALRAKSPGDVVKIRLKRGESEQTVEATLRAR